MLLFYVPASSLSQSSSSCKVLDIAIVVIVAKFGRQRRHNIGTYLYGGRLAVGNRIYQVITINATDRQTENNPNKEVGTAVAKR